MTVIDSMQVWTSMYSLVKLNLKFWKRHERKKYQFLELQFCSKILLKSIYSSNNSYTVHIFFIKKNPTIFRRILSILLYTEVFYIRFVLTTSTWKPKGLNNDGIILSFITCLPWICCWYQLCYVYIVYKCFISCYLCYIS